MLVGLELSKARNQFRLCSMAPSHSKPATSASVAPGHSKPTKSAKSKSSDEGAAKVAARERNASLNASLARGKALKALQKNAAFDISEPILPGTCDITLGQLMESEGLSIADAVQVMLKFRKEAHVTDPDEIGLSLPPATGTAKHSPNHRANSAPASILKKGKSKKKDTEPPHDEDGDYAASKQAGKKRKQQQAAGAKPSEETSSAVSSTPALPAKDRQKKPRSKKVAPEEKEEPWKEDPQDEPPQDEEPHATVENNKQSHKKSKPSAPEKDEEEPQGEASSSAGSKKSKQKNGKKSKAPAPEEEEEEEPQEASSPTEKENSTVEEAVEAKAARGKRGKKRTAGISRAGAKENLEETDAKADGFNEEEFQTALAAMIEEIEKPEDTKPASHRRKRYKQSENASPKDKSNRWPDDWPHDAQPHLSSGWCLDRK